MDSPRRCFGQLGPKLHRGRWKQSARELLSAFGGLKSSYADGDVASYAFVVAVLAEYAKRRRKAAFEICALFVQVIEFGWAREVEHVGHRLDVVEAGLERAGQGGAGSAIMIFGRLQSRLWPISRSCDRSSGDCSCWRSHTKGIRERRRGAPRVSVLVYKR